jgi:hypothetical protein
VTVAFCNVILCIYIVQLAIFAASVTEHLFDFLANQHGTITRVANSVNNSIE